MNGFETWCIVEGCTAPAINGVPLCHHDQHPETDA